MFRNSVLMVITFILGIEAMAAPSSVFSNPQECRAIASRIAYSNHEQSIEACGGALGDCVALLIPMPTLCKSNDCECITVAQIYQVNRGQAGLSKEEATKLAKSDILEVSAHCESQDATAIVIARMFEALYRYTNEPSKISQIRNTVKTKKCTSPLCGAIATYNPEECG